MYAVSLYPFAHHMPVVQLCHTTGENIHITLQNRFIVHCRKCGVWRQIPHNSIAVIQKQGNAVLTVAGCMYDFP